MEIKLNQQSAGRLTRDDIPFLMGLFFLGLFLSLFYTWAMPLIDPDEPRYAVTARDMVLNGNWIVPYFNGVPRINKPPLFYWAIAISYKIFGINEFGARLPSALAAIGTAMITYLWGKRIWGCKNGFWAGVVLIASPLFFLISRLCITDMLLTFFVSASFYLFFIEYMETNKSNKRRLFLYFLLGMVFLVKGHVGIILFVLVTIGFLLWIRDFQYLRRLWYFPGFLLFMAIICAWGIPFLVSLGAEQISTLLYQETFGQFVGSFSHPEPFYYFLPVFMIGFFPWSAFAFITFVYVFKKRKSMPIEEKKQVYFFCSWTIITVIFFSISHSKLMTYILPISPAMALLTILLSRWETEGKFGKGFIGLLWVMLAVSMSIPIVLILTMNKWAPVKYGISTHHIAIPLVVLFVGTLAALFTFLGRRNFSSLQKVFCFANCVFLIVTITYSSKYLGTFRSTKGIVEKYLLDKRKDYTILSCSDIEPSLIFYSGKNVMEIKDDDSFKKPVSEQTKHLYAVMGLREYKKKKDWLQEIKFHAVYQNNTMILLEKMGN
ncbi:MAG: glycosyltransferase family 39 protein [Planctomycetota bacterium]|nr:glycosyltransferase family 39 protein [Planctomycetota bacterium]